MMDVREHPNRRTLLNIVAARPGLSFRSLVRESGLASGTVRHHLTTLEGQRLVWGMRVGASLRHFLGARPDERQRQLDILAACLDELDQRLIEVVQGGPVRGQQRFLDALAACPRSSVQHRLQRLASRGLLVRHDQGRYAVYATGVRVTLRPTGIAEASPEVAA